MASVRPLPMRSTAQKAGYDQVDPMTQWFLGGDTAPAATATGIEDDDRYGLDLMNSGVGGLSFRTISGNGSNFARVNNSGVAFGGTLSHSGSALFSGAMTVTTLTIASGVTVITGASVFGGAATVANGFTVTTGGSTFGGLVTMASTLNVAQTAAFAGPMSVSGVLTAFTAVVVANLTSTGGVLVGAQVVSQIANGTPPYTATSTTVCTNVNADMLDNSHITDLVVVGTYTGDGSHNRAISLGFQPKYVLITSNGSGTDVACHLMSASSGTNIGFARVGGGATNLAMIDETYTTADGFQVDATGVNGISNTSGDTYVYAAWRTW